MSAPPCWAANGEWEEGYAGAEASLSLTDSPGVQAALRLGICSAGDGLRGAVQVFGWDVKTPGYNVLLASLQPSNMQAVAAANAFFQAYIPGSMRTVPHTANGLAYPWQGAGAPEGP